MGYSTTFRLKGEIDERFQPNKYRVPNVSKSMSILTAICLHKFVIETKTFCFYTTFEQIYENLRFALHELICDVEQVVKQNFVLDKNKEIYFYGWQYSDESSRLGFDTLEEFEKCILDQLFQIVACPTSTRFDKNHEDFNEKEDQISDILNDIEYEVKEIVTFNFVQYYREHPELADEDDGIKHFFPKKETEKQSEEKTDGTNK